MTPQQQADLALAEWQRTRTLRRDLVRRAELIEILARAQIGASDRSDFTRQKGVSQMKKFFARFLKDESAAVAVEYGLLLGLISVVSIAAMTLVGTSLQAIFTSVSTSLGAIGA